MKFKQVLVMLATVATLTFGDAMASDIYRYTDADGNVHYVDRPTGAASEERVAISSKRTNTSQVQARVDARSNSSSATNNATASEEGGTGKKMTRAEKKAAKRENDQRCQSYRDQMETLVTSRRLYREDENGERSYLDESQTQEARSRVQELIESECS